VSPPTLDMKATPGYIPGGRTREPGFDRALSLCKG
jgi:hypothetical protein